MMEEDAPGSNERRSADQGSVLRGDDDEIREQQAF